MTLDGINLVKRHPTYYIPEGNVEFLIEDTIFRVHRYFFERESKFFRELFSEAGDSDGTKSVPRYKLDVTVDDFATLCFIWYNPRYTHPRRGKDAWLTILRLATEWQFDEIKELAIRQLEKLNFEPVERIAIYKRYKISEKLLLPSYMALCRSPTLPSPEEGENLGMETLLKIAATRERALLSAAASGCATPTSAAATDDALVGIIAELFQGDLALHLNDKSVLAGGQVANSDVVTVGDPLKKKAQNMQMNGRECESANTIKSNNSKGKNAK